MSSAISTPAPFSGEYRIIRPDGEVRTVQTVGHAERIDDRRTVRVFGTLLDITERKQTEARLEELLGRVEHWAAEMDATISAIADGVVIYGPGGDIVRANAAATAITGFSLAEIGATPNERVAQLHTETADGRPLSVDETPAARALRGEVVRSVLLKIIRPDGVDRWISTSAAPIRPAGGEIAGAVLTLADVTDLRRLQERQEELLHLVSHDLRIPLTVVHGHAQLLAGLAGAEVSLRAIDRAVHRMDGMIGDLVDMARLEGGQLSLTLESIAPGPFLRDLLERLAGALETERIALDVPDDLPPVVADGARLERILVNLLSNALKYSAPGTPVLVRVRPVDDGVAIAVSDHGPGIPPDDLPRLFDRFYRASRGRTAEGLGLGLYITRMLVEAMHGRIAVDSVPGEGSTFTVTLPRA